MLHENADSFTYLYPNGFPYFHFDIDPHLYFDCIADKHADFYGDAFFSPLRRL